VGAGRTVTPNPAEVAAAYRIDCGELFREGSPEIVAIEESDRPIIRLPLPVATVNAPTAAVLYQFREVALAGRDTRVDHFEQRSSPGGEGANCHGSRAWPLLIVNLDKAIAMPRHGMTHSRSRFPICPFASGPMSAR
jgi:hypothetical protein